MRAREGWGGKSDRQAIVIMKANKKIRVLLPLLQVLKEVRPDQRVILMAHFDDKTRDSLYETITNVLRSEKVPFDKRLFLKSKLASYKSDLRYLSNKSKSPTQKRRKLSQIGGGPMSHVLKLAIPLLLNLYAK